MRALAFSAMIFAGCSPAATEPPAAGSVPAGAVAVCAGKAILGDSVASVASASRVDPAEALQRLAHDARLAAEAEARGLDQEVGVQRELKGALARAMLARIKQDNSAPPSPEEIQALRAARWRDFDRPESARVIHAVAMGEGSDEARKVAEAIHKATDGATGEADFEERAKQVPHAGVDVRIERLPPMARDGRNVEEEGSFVVPFAEAALALKAPGEKSPVVATSFGYHVIFLIERIAAYRPTDEEIARIAREEILARRASSAARGLIERLRREHPTALERNAIELTDLLERHKGR